MKRTLLSWSSGKDSAWSLHLLRQQNEYEIVGLLTTFNQAANRVAMHAVRRLEWNEASSCNDRIQIVEIDYLQFSRLTYRGLMKLPSPQSFSLWRWDDVVAS